MCRDGEQRWLEKLSFVDSGTGRGIGFHRFSTSRAAVSPGRVCRVRGVIDRVPCFWVRFSTRSSGGRRKTGPSFTGRGIGARTCTLGMANNPTSNAPSGLGPSRGPKLPRELRVVFLVFLVSLLLKFFPYQESYKSLSNFFSRINTSRRPRRPR